MSVMIKGMDMPKGCHSGCPLTDRDAFTCQITGKDIVFYYVDMITSRPSWCPLVEVKTPHGRLIDADALIENAKFYETEMEVKNAPTVIKEEAEE